MVKWSWSNGHGQMVMVKWSWSNGHGQMVKINGLDTSTILTNFQQSNMKKSGIVEMVMVKFGLTILTLAH
jgi:hypothetical protein